jgi:hypothetical protein
MDPDLKYKKPSYYNYKMMREKVDGFTSVQDLSSGDLKLFSFQVNNKIVYIAWALNGSPVENLSAALGSGSFRVTPVVTELNAGKNPVYPNSSVLNAEAVPLSLTPVFIEAVK